MSWFLQPQLATYRENAENKSTTPLRHVYQYLPSYRYRCSSGKAFETELQFLMYLILWLSCDVQQILVFLSQSRIKDLIENLEWSTFVSFVENPDLRDFYFIFYNCIFWSSQQNINVWMELCCQVSLLTIINVPASCLCKVSKFRLKYLKMLPDAPAAAF